MSVLSATLAQLGKKSFWGETYNHQWGRKEQAKHDKAREDRLWTIMRAMGRPLSKAEVMEFANMTTAISQRTLWGLRDTGRVRMINAHAPRNIRWEAIDAEENL